MDVHPGWGLAVAIAVWLVWQHVQDVRAARARARAAMARLDLDGTARRHTMRYQDRTNS